MDATILAVIGTGLAGIGTATGLFVALWRVQQTGFDTLNRQMQNQFAAADKRWTERFEGIEKRFEMAETHNRERFEMAEKHNDAAPRRHLRAHRQARPAYPRRRRRPEQTASTPCTAASTTSSDTSRARRRTPGRPAPPPPDKDWTKLSMSKNAAGEIPATGLPSRRRPTHPAASCSSSSCVRVR